MYFMCIFVKNLKQKTIMETKEFKTVKDLFGNKVKITKPTGTEFNVDSYELLKDSSRLLAYTTEIAIANGWWNYQFEDLDIPIRCIFNNGILYIFGLNFDNLSEEKAKRLAKSIDDYLFDIYAANLNR